METAMQCLEKRYTNKELRELQRLFYEDPFIRALNSQKLILTDCSVPKMVFINGKMEIEYPEAVKKALSEIDKQIELYISIYYPMIKRLKTP